MSDTSETPAKERKTYTAEEREVIRRVAKSLWKVETKDMPKDAEGRKEAWASSKKGMQATARRLVNHMQRAGIVLTSSAEEKGKNKAKREAKGKREAAD